MPQYKTNFVDIFLSKYILPVQTIAYELSARPVSAPDLPLEQKREIFILNEVARDIKKAGFIPALVDASWRFNLSGEAYTNMALYSQSKDDVGFKLLIAQQLESGITCHVWRMRRSMPDGTDHAFMLRLWNGPADGQGLSEEDMNKFIARPFEPEPTLIFIQAGGAAALHPRIRTRPRSPTILGEDPDALAVLEVERATDPSNKTKAIPGRQ